MAQLPVALFLVGLCATITVPRWRYVPATKASMKLFAPPGLALSGVEVKPGSSSTSSGAGT